MNPVRNLTFSIVIPVLHDLDALKALLGRLEALADAPLEIIVVDGAADPAVETLARQRACIYVATRAGRGYQLHQGALTARGNVLWFLHADAAPASDSIEAMRRAIRAGALGGYFRFQFSGPSAWHKRMLSALINLRCLVGTPYGDQGLFVRRSAYEESSGFPDTELFEEVPLIRAIRSAGHFVRLRLPIGVSARRWERDGWIRRTIGNRLLAIGYWFGLSPNTLARYYRVLIPREQIEC